MPSIFFMEKLDKFMISSILHTIFQVCQKVRFLLPIVNLRLHAHTQQNPETKEKSPPSLQLPEDTINAHVRMKHATLQHLSSTFTAP